MNLEKAIVDVHQENDPKEPLKLAVGMSAEAVSAALAQRSIPANGIEESEYIGRSFTLEQYAHRTKLPENWLKMRFKLSTALDTRSGDAFVKIPYLTVSGHVRNYKMLFGNGESSWNKESGKKMGFYAEHLLPEAVETGFVYIVEDETDAQVLWKLGLPAIGLAAESEVTADQIRMLDGLAVYILSRNDRWGDAFQERVVQRVLSGHRKGKTFRVICDEHPLLMHRKYSPERAAEMIRQAKRTEIQPPRQSNEQVVFRAKGLQGAFVIPEGWKCSMAGIYRRVEFTGGMILVSYQPIVVTRRLKMIDSEEEKLEVAFPYEKGWKKVICPRSLVLTARGIISLADMGYAVTSENAKVLVQFLFELLGQNQDRIPLEETTGSVGWQPGDAKRFIPGASEGLVLDMENGSRRQMEALCQKGDREKWIREVGKCRGNIIFRFIVAASFAAPLLKILGLRSFMVYAWADSGSGKTASVKAALSVWGNPEELLGNFFTTMVGLEYTLASSRDIPVGIDERQLADKKNGQDFLEQIIYMISTGMGKTRGAKNGGLRKSSTWRTIVLATGEQPVIVGTSQTGAGKRVVEVYGSPFAKEQDAAAMHSLTALHFGWAGPEFVSRVIGIGDESLLECYGSMTAELSDAASGKNLSHVASIAAIALADALADQLFFTGGADQEDHAVMDINQGSWKRAVDMAKAIMAAQAGKKEVDINVKAVGFLCDWLAANRENFGSGTYEGRLGDISSDRETAYINNTKLCEALDQAGYSPDKTKRYLADKGLITTKRRSDGHGVDYTVKRKGARFIEFYWQKAIDRIAGPDQTAGDSLDGDGWMTVSEDPDLEEIPFM